MTLDDFRTEMELYRQRAEEEGRERKDSYLPLERLFALYSKLNESERTMADEVIAEWLLSEDQNKRFDARSMINHFEIESAVPALRELASRLASRTSPGERDELEIVRSSIQRLIRAK